MRLLRLLIVAAGLAACAGPAQEPIGVETVAPGGCLADANGSLQAELRGALQAELDWSNAQMECEGDLRPDGQGLRVSIVGPLDTRRLRFIFGINLNDTASGPAVALPTNLTVIVEDEALLYATRGEERCAVETLERSPLEAGAERVAVRGYCIGPAADLTGDTRLLVPTFSFVARVQQTPVDEAQASSASTPAELAR